MLFRSKIRSAVMEMYSTSNKATRILEAFEVLLAEKALNAHSKIWTTSFIEEMRDWSPEGNMHDDALDAVAGCLSSEPIRFTAAVDGKDFKRFNWQGASGQFKALSDFNI